MRTSAPGALALPAALVALAPLSVDAYLPGLPALAGDLEASAPQAQLTLAACLAGLAGGHLVGGALGDVHGRRRPLLAGLAAFAGASLVCAVAPSVELLTAARLAQGASGAVAIVMARAIVADTHSGDARARAYARLLAVGGAAPVLAPVAGAQVIAVASWRGLFGVLAAVGVLLLGLARRLPETLPPSRARGHAGLGAAAARFGSLVRRRAFAGYALAQGAAFGAMFGYIAAAPFVFQLRYGLSAAGFSALFALNALGIAGAAEGSRALLGRLTSAQLLTSGLGVLGAGAIALLGSALLAPSAWLVAPSLFLVVASVGVVLPHASALAVARVEPGEMGSASALLGVGQFAAGAIVAPVVGLMGPRSLTPLAVATVALACLALGAGRLAARRPRRAVVALG